MLKILAIAGALLLTAVTIVLILAARKPDEFRVSRAAAIQVPPDKIFPLIADLRAWAAWSPYEKKDPDMRRKLSGASSGKGAVYEWDGDKTVGTGRMEIVDTIEPSDGAPGKIAIQLDMFAPFEGHNLVEFTISPRDGGAFVVWAMRGPYAFPAKVIGLFFDTDRMVGDDFAAGLASLKSVAER